MSLTVPDYTTQTNTEYKTSIDEGFQNVERTGWSFAPHPTHPTPDMTLHLNAGAIWNGSTDTLTEVAAQTTSTFTAPVTNPRIDRVVVDETTGTYSIVAGTEAASPTAPAIPTGNFPVCQIQFETTTTSIGYIATSTVAAIVDERVPFLVSATSALTLGTPTATTSGTAIDYTSIPTGTKRITINLAGVSVSGTSLPILQIGDSGGIEPTGYLGSGGYVGGASVIFTTGFGLYSASAATIFHGSLTLELLDSSTNTWVCHGTVGRSDSALVYVTGGSKSLTAELDRIRFTTAGGSDTFDAGKMNISYE